MFRTEIRRNPRTGQSYPWIVKWTAMANHDYVHIRGSAPGGVAQSHPSSLSFEIATALYVPRRCTVEHPGDLRFAFTAWHGFEKPAEL